MRKEFRAAFLGTVYGPVGERVRLAGERGPAPTWARGEWAVVTAWNPGGRRVPEEANVQAAAVLLARVRAAGLSPLPAHNGEGEWREEALLIPGARLRQAAAWGADFGQAAVLWGAGRRAALVWLNGEGVVGVERRWVRRVGPGSPTSHP
ncbi:DUF3293 domain-containing protein [Deinococcus apachensis]|uniref:DUF3293 domain-containing protein n=1 Tax=Deinococcus apachensis TaxID=309886 RepID=UPI00037654DF|nr:DUF3293 domain-containing protein [Deinococcus apachensis]